MNRFRLFATATLMALAFTACDEGEEIAPPAPPSAAEGTISGTVMIDGAGVAGITATLSSGATQTTGANGNFAFTAVPAGSYTVTVSGGPADAAFPNATQAATISSDGQVVQLNFAGQYIRSSSVVGVVGADGDALEGVTVTLGGAHAMSDPQSTGMDGGFAFSGLRAGAYTVTISGHPEDVEFDALEAAVEVGMGDVGRADFPGAYIRTSGLEGLVTVGGAGLAGVTVSLAGGPEGSYAPETTDAGGRYAFAGLRPGEYQVGISGYDRNEVDFAETSENVTLALGQTATVPTFEGVLLRTSSISGRVSVEGMGLEDVAVTLSMAGADDRMAMTDGSGQYAFSGLEAGEYVVSVMVDDPAYVFAEMSMDVTLGEDQAAIANFEGTHARTASVSGMLFIDELAKNGMYDEGEHPLPRAQFPVVLVGPGVNDQQTRVTGPDGTFSFGGLVAGDYQVVAFIDAQVAMALAAADLAYGGPATGYPVTLAAGQSETVALPFGITHTTVGFGVTLRRGDMMGDPVPGATVNLYADAGGGEMVASGMTGDDGMAAIKVARAMASGNMVYASVTADGYMGDPDAGRQMVTWDPQMFTAAAMNEGDLVNLNVDATVMGATIETGYGGGDPLAGWAINVMMGDEMVEGAPEMLDDMGMASLTATVEMDELPATFSFNVADDQANSMDGGEAYAGMAAEYTHTGLDLMGTMDAGAIEVRYTTQTLRVYVHHEMDQVMGYSGNILGGDVRDNGMVTVGIRHIDDSGRSRAFDAGEVDTPDGNGSDGMWMFSGVPAGARVIAQASLAADAEGVMLLGVDELAAYTDVDANGIMGGAFGEMGGFSHTVSLCPLQNPDSQDLGDECSSFAYVTTHTVSGQVWMRDVKVPGEGDGFTMLDEVHVPGVMAGIMPVEGQNLAGMAMSATTAESDDKNTDDLNETHDFRFTDVAAGVYKVAVSAGWRVKMGAMGSEEAVGDALSPLADDVMLDVTPATATLYGRVNNDEGFPAEGVTVTANGMTATTDSYGRYVIGGLSGQTGKDNDGDTRTNSIFVGASAEGMEDQDNECVIGHAANTLVMCDIELAAPGGATASVSGTVTASGTGAPIAGVKVEISSDGGENWTAPSNANAKSSGSDKNDIYLTGADGTYTAVFAAMAAGQTVMVRVSKAGWSFVPGEQNVPAHEGQETGGINFTGFAHATITGRVVAPEFEGEGFGPMAGVMVSAGGDSYVTGTTGTFWLSVPFGTHTVTASVTDDVYVPTQYTLYYPATGQDVNVAPGQSVDFGTITSTSLVATRVFARRNTGANGNYTDVTIGFFAGDLPEPVDRNLSSTRVRGQVKVGDEDWYGQGNHPYYFRGTDSGDVYNDSREGGSSEVGVPTAGPFQVRAVTTSNMGTNDTSDDITHYTDPITVGPVDTRATLESAARGEVNTDSVHVTLTARLTSDSNLRVLAEIQVTDDRAEWLDLFPVAGPGSRETLQNLATLAGTPVDRADGTGQTTVTAEMLAKAFKVAVEWNTPGIDEAGVWRRSNVIEVGAKP